MAILYSESYYETESVYYDDFISEMFEYYTLHRERAIYRPHARFICIQRGKVITFSLRYCVMVS